MLLHSGHMHSESRSGADGGFCRGDGMPCLNDGSGVTNTVEVGACTVQQTIESMSPSKSVADLERVASRCYGTQWLLPYVTRMSGSILMWQRCYEEAAYLGLCSAG